jgi:pSer/pThr/pTyr-binding forkhead associated (FHA) protein
MPAVTFQVVEGMDKGRVFLFRDLGKPLTIGREEGNLLRLNDERVSRFHAKVQADDGEVILTDCDSTNGTRVNGNVIQIRRLRIGDRICVGRSVLLFGSREEIEAREATLSGLYSGQVSAPPATPHARTLVSQHFSHDVDLPLDANAPLSATSGTLFLGSRPLPPLPQKMSPSQVARLAELLDFLHRHLTAATENVHANEEGTQMNLGFGEWQRVLAVQMVLARYVRAVTEPESLDD